MLHGPSDTSSTAAEVQRWVWARMSPSDKLRMTLQMSEEVRELSIQGELSRHPEASPADARRIVVRRVLGDALYEAAFGGR